MLGMDVNFSGLVLVLEVLTGLGIVVHLSQTCSNMVYGWLCVLVLFNTSSQANNSRVIKQRLLYYIQNIAIVATNTMVSVVPRAS